MPEWSMARRGPEPARVFRRLRDVFGGKRPGRSRENMSAEETFVPGRDPVAAGEALGLLTHEMGWREPLAEAQLLVSWREIVGDNIADHSQPVSVEKGVLTLSTDSSAWATQLRLMRHELLSTLGEKVSEIPISSIHVRGPGAPSWKSGPRSVPGRGPRDTYG
jgi:predicted nucleic acid-binding Zn ribbon protein